MVPNHQEHARLGSFLYGSGRMQILQAQKFLPSFSPRTLLRFLLPPSHFQFSSVAQLYLTLCESMDCSTPGFPIHHQLWSLLKLMPIESVMPFNHLILCQPLLLLPSIFPSISFFQCVGSSHQVAKVLELQLQHQSFQ